MNIKRINQISSRILILVASFTIFTGTLLPTLVIAQTPKEAVCEGVGLGSGGSGCNNPEGSPNVDSAVQTGLKFFAAIVGIIAVVMIMVGGLRYMMSGGDAGKAASAQNTVIYALVGLVVALMAQLIAQFVLSKFSK